MAKKIPEHLQSSCMTCAARQFAWFEPGSADQVLAERQKYRSHQLMLDSNEYLFVEGDEHKAAYTLKEGWAICYKQLLNGQRQVLHIALPGDFLGYQTDFDEPIDYTVMAASDCKFCSFTPEAIDSLLAKDITLIKRLMEIQNKQSKACKSKLSVIGQAPAKHKVAFFFLDLLTRLERRGINTSDVITFHLRREDIADAIGVTSVHLSRIMVELGNEKIVECSHNKLMVQDLDKLKELAEVSC